MRRPIECAGAPRDLGLDQGRVCADAVVARIAERGIVSRRLRAPRIRRLAAGGALGGGIGREVLRHYPHLGERMSGIARASNVALDALMELLVIAAYGNGGDPLSAPAIGCAARDGAANAVLARPLDAATPWIVRRSRPEIGFRSVELTLPWLASAVAGVNEHGIAALVAPVDAPLRLHGLGGPPASLLVQECLQRFDSIEAAIEWCLERPAAGALGIVVANDRGDSAAIEFSGAERRLVLGDAFAIAGGSPACDTRVRKQLSEGGALTPQLLREAQGDAAASLVWIDPATRTLELHSPAAGEPDVEPAGSAKDGDVSTFTVGD